MNESVNGTQQFIEIMLARCAWIGNEQKQQQQQQ